MFGRSLKPLMIREEDGFKDSSKAFRFTPCERLILNKCTRGKYLSQTVLCGFTRIVQVSSACYGGKRQAFLFPGSQFASILCFVRLTRIRTKQDFARVSARNVGVTGCECLWTNNQYISKYTQSSGGEGWRDSQ